MGKAGLNTLLGMGTVFIVLIVLSLLISSFSLINKAQTALENRNKAESTGSQPAASQPAPVAEVVPAAGGDDKIAAVISAAIAAYESESGISLAESGGYYVRSIRRRSNNKWNKN